MVLHISPIIHNVSANRHSQSPHHAWWPTRENIDLHVTLADANRAFHWGLIGREHIVHNSLYLGPPAIAEDFQAVPHFFKTILTEGLVTPFCDIHRCIDFWCLRCLQHRQTPFCLLKGLHDPNEMNSPCRL